MISFVHPFFLAGLTLLGLPIALHMMNREIPVRLQFPSIRFIRRAQLPREGRKKLQDILVLCLRLLLLAAVVLVFARPRWRPKNRPVATPGRRTETVVLLDASASMGGWSGMENARRQLRQLVEQDDIDLGLVVSSNRVMTTVAPEKDHQRVVQAVEDLTPEPVPGEHAQALEQALRLFSPQKEHTLVILSDFQQTDWQPNLAAIVPEGMILRLLDVCPERSENAGITSAAALPISSETLRVIAEVRNFGTAPVKRVLTLNVAGETFSHELHIPALQVQKTAFAIPKPSVSQGQLTLTPDAYRADDSYSVWLGEFPSIKVLAVAPLKQEPRKAQELFFLKKALSIKDDASPVDYAIETVEADFLFALNLDAFGAILLLGAAGYFGEDEFTLLRNYLTDGGVALCTPGNAAGHLFHGLRQHNLIAARFLGVAGERTASRETFGLGWVNPDSALGAVFRDADQTDLFLFPIYRYVRLGTLKQAEVLLKTLDGDPALLTRSIGTGKIYVSAFGFDPSWSDLPMTGSFLPLVRELMADAVPDDYGVTRLECGDPIPVPEDALGTEPAVDGAGGTGASTSQPGVFVIGETPYEVNVSRRESVVEKTNRLDLQQALTGGAQSTAPGAPVLRDGAPLPEWRSLWPHCALAAAALLLCEMLLTALLDRRELAGRRA